MEPTVVELSLVSSGMMVLRVGVSSNMLATFFRVPFCRSGMNSLVTQWTPRTLAMKLSVRFSLST